MENVLKITKEIKIFREISIKKINDLYCAYKDYQYNSEGEKISLKEGITLLNKIKNIKDFEPIEDAVNIVLVTKNILKVNQKLPWNKYYSTTRNECIKKVKPYTYIERFESKKETKTPMLVNIYNYNLLDLEGNLYKKALCVSFSNDMFDLEKLLPMLESQKEFIKIEKGSYDLNCFYLPNDEDFKNYEKELIKIKNFKEEESFVLNKLLKLPKEVFLKK